MVCAPRNVGITRGRPGSRASSEPGILRPPAAIHRTVQLAFATDPDDAAARRRQRAPLDNAERAGGALTDARRQRDEPTGSRQEPVGGWSGLAWRFAHDSASLSVGAERNLTPSPPLCSRAAPQLAVLLATARASCSDAERGARAGTADTPSRILSPTREVPRLPRVSMKSAITYLWG